MLHFHARYCASMKIRDDIYEKKRRFKLANEYKSYARSRRQHQVASQPTGRTGNEGFSREVRLWEGGEEFFGRGDDSQTEQVMHRRATGGTEVRDEGVNGRLGIGRKGGCGARSRVERNRVLRFSLDSTRSVQFRLSFQIKSDSNPNPIKIKIHQIQPSIAQSNITSNLNSVNSTLNQLVQLQRLFNCPNSPCVFHKY